MADKDKRTIFNWLPIVMSALSLIVSLTVAYYSLYPRPGLLFRSLPLDQVVPQDLITQTIKFVFINTGNRDILVVSARFASAKLNGLEWTQRADIPPIINGEVVKAQEARVETVQVPKEWLKAQYQQQYGEWIGLAFVVIAPSGHEYHTVFPVASYNNPALPGLGQAGFCPQHRSLLEDIRILPSTRNACTSQNEK